MCNKCNCEPTYLVTSITDNSGANYILNFRTTPVLQDKECIKFRLADCITTATTPALQIFANVSVNGSIVSVPLRDEIGNNVRTGCKLRTRKVYKAVFGTDDNHLQVLNLGCNKCSKI
ncbi:MAG: hypothetical protein ACI4S3_07395 [Candidatus Gastranaerophilaceae bacterium]